MTARHDALIIGGGIVGAACALYLAQRGVRPLVLEADFVGSGATSAGMGHLTVMDDSPAQFALSAHSCKLWSDLGEKHGEQWEDDPCGTLWVAAEEDELALVASKAAFYRGQGLPVEELSAAELRRAEPELRPDLSGGLLVPGDRVIYAPKAVRWLMDQAVSLGAEVRKGTRVRSLEDRKVVCDSGPVEADVIILAAGAQSSRILPSLPLEPRKGHLVVTDRYPDFCRHQILELGYLQSAHEMSGESVAFNVQPRATQQVLIGSSRELVGWDKSVNRDVVSAMIERAVEYMPRLATLSVLRVWTGFRPATRDNLPFIGRWEPIDGLWIATGHEGLGITTSLATGELLADLIVSRQPTLDPGPFDPMRVAGGS
ncbi:MAG: FAD-dependent oxidoreductase [Thermoanaerobaculia bacterium]